MVLLRHYRFSYLVGEKPSEELADGFLVCTLALEFLLTPLCLKVILVHNYIAIIYLDICEQFEGRNLVLIHLCTSNYQCV